MDWQQQPQDWNDHGYPKEQSAWQGEFQNHYNYYEQYLLFQERTEHESIVANQIKGKGLLERRKMIDDLFDDTGLYSYHSQRDSDPELQSDEEDLQSHGKSTETNDDEVELSINMQTQANTRRHKHERKPGSRRYIEDQKNDEVQRLWAANGLSVEMGPKDLARRVVLLRSEPNIPVNAQTIGKRATQIVRKAFFDPNNPNKTEDPYVTMFSVTMKDINSNVHRVKQRMGKVSEIRNLNDQQYEEFAHREAIRWNQEKEENPDTPQRNRLRASKRRQLEEMEVQVSRVGELLLNQLALKEVDINKISSTDLATIARQLKIPDMPHKELIQYVRKFLLRYEGKGQVAEITVRHIERLDREKDRAKKAREKKVRQRNSTQGENNDMER